MIVDGVRPNTALQPIASARREQRYLAVVLPSAFWRALPATARG
jgi:hypothetical protein